uniref:Ly6/PLAUR domain-containing protein 1 isoform X3 n=1 Tax=Geotrypetes seraphini TaxID=260995 RepID=A0A6P8QYK9_GEOSA|nr:ly6/PLAUR domain-containing protein 1 isoform X3 [Geotrypetes seraphini]
MRLLVLATFWGCFWATGFGLQIQCYQCEEFLLNNDCSSPEFIVNCTVNVQDMCQKEVIEKSYGSVQFCTVLFMEKSKPWRKRVEKVKVGKEEEK